MNSGKLSRGDYAMYIAMFKLEDYLYKNINYILECTKIYNKKYAIKSDSAEDIKSIIKQKFSGNHIIWDYYKKILDAIYACVNTCSYLCQKKEFPHYTMEYIETQFYDVLDGFDAFIGYLEWKKPERFVLLDDSQLNKAKWAFTYLCVNDYPFFDYQLRYPKRQLIGETAPSQPVSKELARQLVSKELDRLEVTLKEAGLPCRGFTENRVMLQNALMQESEKVYSLTRPRSIGAQYTAGNSNIARNRINYMNPNYEFEKLRDIAEEDIVRLLAHRAPGEEYKSIHPPLEEMEEPDCVVRQMVEPTEGAKAGDKIISVSFTDSLLFAPITPYQRALSAYCRYKGVDCGVSSGRTIIEARERDIEKITKEQVDSEVYDTARTGLRGRAMYGHSVRLDANGMMFDALRRWARDERTGEVSYVKDMIGGAMDKEVTLGKPMSEDELRKRTTMYRNAQGGVWQEVDDPESMDVCAEIHWKRTVGGFQPWKKISDIKGGKKDVGVKNLKLFVPRGGVE